MKTATLHYRVRGDGRILAYGCGWSGLPSVLRTDDWRKVTCANCKRTKEWRAAAGDRTPQAKDTEKGEGR